MEIEVESRVSGFVLFTHKADDNTLKAAVEAAVKAGANLGGAHLTGANLGGAHLGGANLEGAYLAGADMAGLTWGMVKSWWASTPFFKSVLSDRVEITL